MPSFDKLDKDKHLKISSKGGSVSSERGTAHKFTKQQASDAAKKRWADKKK